jgi:hypothetical protein
MHNDVDALYGVDLEGNGAKEMDGYNEKKEDEKEAEDQGQHQHNKIPSGRNGCVKVDALHQSPQRHPSGGLHQQNVF